MDDARKKIDNYLSRLPAWQKNNLVKFRELVHALEPSIVEEWKWSTLTFSLNKKMFFAMGAFKAHTKYNFLNNGATIQDKDNLFNNGLDSKKSRSIDLKEGEQIDESRLKDLIITSIKNGQ